jgi:hypothetical protein
LILLNGTIDQSEVKLSANWTAPARIGWTVSSQANTFLGCHVCDVPAGSDQRAIVRRSAIGGGPRLRVGEESETHEWTHWGAGVSSLSDAERDACDVVQALAGLAALLARQATDRSGTDRSGTDDRPDPEADDIRRTLLNLAQDGGTAAVRVLAYLRTQRGAGDGESAAVPPRLGMWRDWVPPRGYVLGSTAGRPRIGEVHHRRRSEPGE